MNQPAEPPATYLFVLPWDLQYVGGVTSVVDELAKIMATHGSFTPCIAVESWTDSSPRRTDKCVCFRFSILASPTAIDLLKACVAAPWRLWHTFRLLSACNAQVVNFHYPGLAPIGVAILKRLGLYRGKLLLSYHGTDVGSPGGRIKRAALRFIQSSADHLVACSNSLATRMMSQFDVPASKVEVIFNGIDESIFDGLGELGSDSRLTLPGEFIVNVGSFIPRKNQTLLIEAFEMLAPRYPALNLCIAGADGPDRQAIEDAIRTRGLADRVHLFTGLRKREVSLLLSNAAVCAQTSLAEAFPLAVLEAGASGCPVVVSDIPGHDEQIAHGTTGLRFPSGDASACAAAIASMLDDPSAASRMAAAHWQRVRQSFTLLSQMKAYERIASQD